MGGTLETIAGDPLFGGGVGELSVMRLASADGAELWRQIIPNTVAQGGPHPNFIGGVVGTVWALAPGENGDVLLAGVTNGGWQGIGSIWPGDFTFARLAGATGDVVWSQNAGPGEAHSIAAVLDEPGAVVVAGEMEREGVDGEDFAVVKFSDCLDGQKLQLKDNADPKRRRLIGKGRDRRIASSAPGSLGDPSLYGARLIVTDADTMENRTYDLPASGWEANRRGYRYRDRNGSWGPCRSAQLKGGGRLDFKCEGVEVDLQADTTLQRVAVRFEFGAGASRYCLEFGGKIRSTQGRFKARNAPAPSRCLGE